MTAVTHAAAARRRSAPEPPRQTWEKNGVLAAIAVAALTQLGAAIWAFSGVATRLASIEQELPAGEIQRLDERTLQMQAALARLEDHAAGH